MIDSHFLDVLCCPETRQSLTLADTGLVASINKAIAAGSLKNRAGEIVLDPLEGGLLRQDGKWLYPLKDGVPVLLMTEALPVS